VASNEPHRPNVSAVVRNRPRQGRR
jgi:hypothetical protein